MKELIRDEEIMKSKRKTSKTRHILTGHVRIMDFPSQPLGDAKPGAKEHDMQLIHSSPADSFRGRQVRMWTNP